MFRSFRDGDRHGDPDQRLLDVCVQQRHAADGGSPEGEAAPVMLRSSIRRPGPPVAIAEERRGRSGRPCHSRRWSERRASSRDTFTQARAGGARVHDAIDIMADEGTPVIAATDGTVEKLFFSDGGGGITAYVRSPDQRWTYYYAHLQGYAPGLAEGQKVKRGQLIGRVGHTGNANPAGTASPLRDQSDARRREMVPGDARSTPTRCLPGKGPAAKAAANPRAMPAAALSSVLSR